MNRNREIVVVSEILRSGIDREKELEYIHRLLSQKELPDQLCRIYEILDLNRYKVISHPGLVKKVLLRKDKKTFEFLFNKN